MTPVGTTSRARGRPTLRLVLLASLALAAAGTLVAIVVLGSWGGSAADPGGTALLAVWTLLPLVLMGVAVVLTDRAWPRGWLAVVLGVVVVVALTALALHALVTSESSTTVLVLVVVPFYQLLVALVATGAAAGAHALLRRRTRAATDADGSAALS